MSRLDPNFPRTAFANASPLYKVDGDVRDQLAEVSSAMDCIGMMLNEVTQTELPHDGLAQLFHIMADRVTSIAQQSGFPHQAGFPTSH